MFEVCCCVGHNCLHNYCWSQIQLKYKTTISSGGHVGTRGWSFSEIARKGAKVHVTACLCCLPVLNSSSQLNKTKVCSPQCKEGTHPYLHNIMLPMKIQYFNRSADFSCFSPFCKCECKTDISDFTAKPHQMDFHWQYILHILYLSACFVPSNLLNEKIKHLGREAGMFIAHVRLSCQLSKIHDGCNSWERSNVGILVRCFS